MAMLLLLGSRLIVYVVAVLQDIALIEGMVSTVRHMWKICESF